MPPYGRKTRVWGTRLILGMNGIILQKFVEYIGVVVYSGNANGICSGQIVGERGVTVNCELVSHHLIPNSAVVTDNGRILQVSVQHQHCENGLYSFNDIYRS